MSTDTNLRSVMQIGISLHHSKKGTRTMHDPTSSEPPPSVEGIVTRLSPFSVEETLARIQEAIHRRNLSLFAHIDHSGEAQQVGLTMQKAHVLIFGNPTAGTPLMTASPLLALDLPLKVLIWQGDKEGLDTQYNQFNLLEVLQEQARGLTMLRQPEKALTIYAETDKMQQIRPLRALGSYLLLKAQAHAYSGDMDTGINLALQGLKLARIYGSPRHISRAQDMCDRLHITELGQHARMKDLKQALMAPSAPSLPVLPWA